MAQSGYPAFYQQPTYSYPSQAPPPPGPAQAYDARGIPQYTSQYQQSPYPCPPTSPQQPYGYATPPVQRPPSRINPSPVLVSQVGPPSQYPRPPPSPQLYNAPASNPYPSPVSPQTPHTGTPQSSRRPLPTPRNLPAPPNSAGLPPPNVPQPPTSPQPAYATHRPTQSVPSVFPAYPQPHVNTYPVAAREPSPSPTSSAFSATSTSPPRPLPLPRSAGTFDLSSAPAQHNEPRPQSPPKRALPAPQPLQTHDSSIQSPEPVSASGQKFVPLWKRALPQPGASPSRVLPSPSETRPQGSVERRSTVSSGGSRPLPPSPSNANGSVVGLPRDPLARAGTLPPHLQLPNLPPTPQSPAEQSFSRPPPTAPPAAGPSNPSTSPSTSPPSSRFMLRERSRTLPLPSAAPTYPLPPKPGQPPSPSASNVTGQPLSQSPHSSDDEELTNALLERHQRSPSPQFGIRDLPRNTAGQSRSIPGPMNAHANGDSTPRARRDLPSPGTGPQNQSAGQLPSRSQSGDGESSLAFRMAAVSLQGQSQSQPPAEAQAQPFRPGHGQSKSISGGNSSRPMPQPPSNPPIAPSRQSQPPPQTAQQQRSGWPSNLPPLPRAPVSPQPGAQSSFASQAQAQAQGPAETRSRPLPVRSNTASANVTPFGRPRSPRKADLDLNLDDAPPPSLRRSPAPSGNTQAQPSFMNSRAGSSRAGASLQRAPSQNTTASVFSLSAFPKPPSHVESPNPPSPTKFGFRPPSPAKQWQDNSNVSRAQPRPPSPAKQWQDNIAASRSQPQPPSPPKQWQSSIGTTNRTQPPPPSPTKQWQTTITSSRSQPQPPSPTKQWQDRSQPPPQPQPPSPTKTAPFTVRAPSPTKYTNPPSFAVPEQRTQPSPRIPKISFPASLDGDSDEDDIGGPVINISGPSDSRRIFRASTSEAQMTIHLSHKSRCPENRPPRVVGAKTSHRPAEWRRRSLTHAWKRRNAVGWCAEGVEGLSLDASSVRWICAGTRDASGVVCATSCWRTSAPTRMMAGRIAIWTTMRNSLQDVTIARPRSSTNASSRSTTPSLASARTTSNTSSAPSAATLSFPHPTPAHRRAHSLVMASSPWAQRTTSGSPFTKAIHTARRATSGCVCPNARNARRASAMACRPLKHSAESGAGSALPVPTATSPSRYLHSSKGMANHSVNIVSAS
ncbi:hypothetical protein C8Q70DRAFT_299769 [Cubamyces menziesii]|nr:hypothetical protein C8Q70DRAFT_299769 [Cubamyces menziesii]